MSDAPLPRNDQVLATQRGNDVYHSGPTCSLIQGKYAEAEALYERSQAILEKALGPEHPDVAGILNERAGLLQAQVGIEKEFCFGSTLVRELLKFPDAPLPGNDRVLATQHFDKFRWSDVHPLF